MEELNPEERVMQKITLYKKVVNTSKLESLFNRYLRTSDFSTAASLLSKVYAEINNLAKKFPLAGVVQSPVNTDKTDGLFGVGTVEGDAPKQDFMISKRDVNKNILVAASVGHGKTSLLYILLKKLSSAGVNYILFDMKKDYTSLAMEENTIYLDSSNLRINPFEPPVGVSKKEWAIHLVDAFSHTFSLLIGSRDFLLEHVLKFYSKWSGDYPPSILDFLNYLDGLNGRLEYLRVVKGRLKALTAVTDIFNCNTGISLSKLDGYNLILAIDDLGIAEQNFVASFILSYLFYARLKDVSNRGKLSKAVVIDDAHTILDSNKERDYPMGIPLIHGIISKMRELGVGFVFADQQISSLLSSVIQNTNIKFIGRINMVEDLNKIFGKRLDKNVESDVLSLGVGEFLVLSPGINPYCKITVEGVRVPKNTDQAVLSLNKERYKPLLVSNLIAPESALEKKALMEIDRNPSCNISSHIKNMSGTVSEEEFHSAVRKLKDSGVLGEVSFQLSEGKTSKFLYIKSSPYGKPGDGSPTIKPYDSVQFSKMILKEVVKSALARNNIAFSEDDVGLLLNGAKKVYITFMDKGEGLIPLLQSPFHKLIDVVEDSLTEGDVLSEIINKNETHHVNLGAVEVKHARDFSYENFNSNILGLLR